MSPVYQKELDFSIALLKRMRIPVHLVRPQDPWEPHDRGLHKIIGLSKSDYTSVQQLARRWSDERTIYKLEDLFACNYIYFLLPNTLGQVTVVIGPYLTAEPSREMLREQAERLGMDAVRVQQQEEYYASLPVLNDPSPILAIVTCLGECLWGDPSSYRQVDVNTEQMSILSNGHKKDCPIEQEDVLLEMKQLEMRYEYENELMEVVSKGLTYRAESMMANVSLQNYPNRSADPLRNMKNSCIICNTLLRKAAQNGGVHPLYLDRMSDQYARRIEASATPEAAADLIGDMIRSYCRLVNTHTRRPYASAVQKTLTYIESNLSADLSLHHLAELVQVSPGYLSTLFHRETGHTLSEHITAQRMKAALQMLTTTQLQVQTVAQLTGFSDPNYFSKMFKSFYGITPQQSRKKLRGAHPVGDH